MEWLVPHKLFVAQIQPFDELEEYAFKAIEKKEPVGDHKMVSIKREYSMDIPPRFERWLCNTIDTQFDLQTSSAPPPAGLAVGSCDPGRASGRSSSLRQWRACFAVFLAASLQSQARAPSSPACSGGTFRRTTSPRLSRRTATP